MNKKRTTNRVALINGLFNGQPVNPDMNTWHARISAAVKAGKAGKAGKPNKLPDDDYIEPAVFNGWAYDNFAADLPPPGLTVPRDTHVLPKRYLSLPIEARTAVGEVVVTAPPPKGTSTEELMARIQALQIELHQEQQRHTKTKKELAQKNELRSKSSAAGKTGGRGNEK